MAAVTRKRYPARSMATCGLTRSFGCGFSVFVCRTVTNEAGITMRWAGTAWFCRASPPPARLFLGHLSPQKQPRLLQRPSPFIRAQGGFQGCNRTCSDRLRLPAISMGQRSRISLPVASRHSFPRETQERDINTHPPLRTPRHPPRPCLPHTGSATSRRPSCR